MVIVYKTVFHNCVQKIKTIVYRVFLEGGEMTLELQVHTLAISHRITKKEALYISNLYGKKLTADVLIDAPKIRGINEIRIIGNPIKEAGVFVGLSYTLELQINVGRLLNISNVAMTNLNKNNVQSMINKLNHHVLNRFQMELKNSDVANWNITRLDCGLDVKYDDYDETTMKARMELLHNTFNPLNKCRCDYTRYRGYDLPKVRQESITVNNASYTYNIYYKLLQLIDKYKNNLSSLSQKEWDEIRNVIRVEKQMTNTYLGRVLGKGKELSKLLDEDILNNIMNSIIADMKAIFGTGIHVSYEEGIQIIENSHYSEEDKVQLKLLYASVDQVGFPETLKYMEQLVKKKGGKADEVQKMEQEIVSNRRKIEALGISVVPLRVNEMSHFEDINTAIDNMAKKKPKTRSKGKFCSITPDIKNNRFRCNPTYHFPNGQVKRVSVAGKTREAAEMAVLEKLRDLLRENTNNAKGDYDMQIAYNQCAMKDVENFKTVIERQEMLDILDDVIRQIKNRIQLLENKKRGI